MANPSTTHVIEIESGIGEPAFIPLSMGTELQPISIGKKGMWKVDGARVMDVHAFVYFDGTSLFLQSADESQAAVVDGYRIGKAWTELHAPCKIEVGGARLRFRSLLPSADGQATQAAPRPPVAAPPSAPNASAPPRPAAGAPPEAPLSFPKVDRPFKPGEFSRGGQDLDESTRFAPLDSTSGGGGSRSGASGSLPARPPGQEDELSTRPEAVRLAPRPPTAGGSGGFPAQPMGAPPPMGGQMGGMGMPPQGSMPPQLAPTMMAMQGSMPPSMPPTAPPQYAQQGYPPAAGSYPGAPMPPGAGSYPGAPMHPGASGPYPAAPPQGSLPPGGYGSTQAQPAPPDGLAAQFAAMSVPKKILVFLLPVAMLFTVMSFFDDEPQPRKNPSAVALDAGGAPSTTVAAVTTPPPPVTVPPTVGAATGGTGGTTTAQPAWPAGVPCPPPNWPPNTPLPCVPNNVATQPTLPTKPASDIRDAGAPTAAAMRDAGASGAKTLERLAVDAVAAGDTATAARLYEELSRNDPNNRVYAEAARILRNKLDAGAP